MESSMQERTSSSNSSMGSSRKQIQTDVVDIFLINDWKLGHHFVMVRYCPMTIQGPPSNTRR